VNQLAQRNSDYHADRVSVEYVDQLATQTVSASTSAGPACPAPLRLPDRVYVE
jgi:hypothetical protein